MPNMSMWEENSSPGSPSLLSMPAMGKSLDPTQTFEIKRLESEAASVSPAGVGRDLMVQPSPH